MPTPPANPSDATRYLLDTNTLIYAQKRQGRCLDQMEQRPATALSWSVISLQELMLGVAKSANPQRLRAYLAELRQRYQLFDYTPPCAERAGLLQGALERQGTPIGPYDIQIAAIALTHNLTVVTRNVREFSRVPGLQLENWYEA